MLHLCKVVVYAHLCILLGSCFHEKTAKNLDSLGCPSCGLQSTYPSTRDWSRLAIDSHIKDKKCAPVFVAVCMTQYPWLEVSLCGDNEPENIPGD